MSFSRILGVALLVAGAISIAFALLHTSSVTNTVNAAFGGTFTDETWQLFGGAGGVLLGVMLMATSRSRSQSGD